MQENSPSRQSSPRRLVVNLLVAAGMIVAGFAGALAGGAAVYLSVNRATPATATASVSQEVSHVEVSYDVSTAITEAVTRVGPAVVTVVNHLQPQQTIFGMTGEATASGSGVIISADGYIVTNNHVVDGAQSLEVTLADGTTLSARLVGVDPFADLAVLKVEGTMPAVAEWGDSDTLEPGETVIAIGSPLGDLANTVTVGVISATDRSIEAATGYQMEGMLQTDAAINSGNSGGPLVSLAGQVVGINTLVVRGNGLTSAAAEGLGFAISSNTARAVIEQLIARGYVSHPYLGIQWEAVNTQQASGKQSEPGEGVLVTEVTPGGPADQAGLQRGDIITAVDGRAISSDSPFINLLFQHSPGETISLSVLRGTQQLDVSLTLAERPRS